MYAASQAAIASASPLSLNAKAFGKIVLVHVLAEMPELALQIDRDLTIDVAPAVSHHKPDADCHETIGRLRVFVRPRVNLSRVAFWDFCNNIGTFRTCRARGPMSVLGSKAEMT
jgi:hypothetical protein